MLSLRTFWNDFGEKVPEFIDAEESSSLSQGSLIESTNPKWRDDPSYHWARKGARKRRM